VGAGLVEQQHPGTGEHGPGEGDALALTGRESAPALADAGVESVGQGRDELAEAARGHDRGDCGIVGPRVAVADVVGNRAAQQRQVGAGQADGLAQVALVELAHVDAVEEHAAAAGLDEPGQQGQSRGLARAVGPDHSDHGSGFGDEVDAVEHLAQADAAGLQPAGSLGLRARNAPVEMASSAISARADSRDGRNTPSELG
jgi:hypothetical protein